MKNILAADFPDSGRKVVFNPVNYRSYILNRTAGEIWDYCKIPKDKSAISNYLCKKYSLRINRAKKDSASFIRALKKIGLFEYYGRNL